MSRATPGNNEKMLDAKSGQKGQKTLAHAAVRYRER